MTSRLLITALTYVLAGMLPALIAHYLLRARFIGGVWAALLVALISSFVGGLLNTFFLRALPDLIPIGSIVDAGPPLILSIVVTTIFALISRSNSS